MLQKVEGEDEEEDVQIETQARAVNNYNNKDLNEDINTNMVMCDPWSYQCGKCGKSFSSASVSESRIRVTPFLLHKFNYFAGPRSTHDPLRQIPLHEEARLPQEQDKLGINLRESKTGVVQEREKKKKETSIFLPPNH